MRKQLVEANKKLSTSLRFEKSTRILNDMLRQHKYSKIKFGIGYDAEQPSSSNAIEKKNFNDVGKMQKDHEANSLKLPIKDKEIEHKEQIIK